MAWRQRFGMRWIEWLRDHRSRIEAVVALLMLAGIPIGLLAAHVTACRWLLLLPVAGLVFFWTAIVRKD